MEIHNLRLARTFSAIQHNLSFTWLPDRVSVIDNILSDALSRWSSTSKRAAFWNRCKDLDINPTERYLSPHMFEWSHL